MEEAANCQEGPTLPHGPAVGEGELFTPSIWEREYQTKAHGEHFDWIAEWDVLSGIIKPHLNLEGRILQTGCGNSQVAAALHKEGFRDVLSIDTSPTVIEIMKTAHAHLQGLEYVVMNALEIECADGSFDTVIDKATLEAIPLSKHECYVREICRVLRDGGKYVVVTDLRESFLPKANSLELVQTERLARLDHALGEVAYVYIFVKLPAHMQTSISQSLGVDQSPIASPSVLAPAPSLAVDAEQEDAQV